MMKTEKSRDLIRRADAIEAVMNIEPTFDTRSLEPYQKEKDVVSAIESLPSASVETEMSLPKWIPCSDRFPDENEVVLTQANFKDDVKMAVSSRIDVNYWTGWGTREINIVAWMPLPPSYKGGEDE